MINYFPSLSPYQRALNSDMILSSTLAKKKTKKTKSKLLIYLAAIFMDIFESFIVI